LVAEDWKPWALGVVLIFALVLGVFTLTGGSGSGSGGARSTAVEASTPSSTRVSAVAAPVPTNRVTGSGTATVRLQGDVLTVELRTRGLLNGSPHLAHIHGLGLGTCPTASAARLHGGHLSISTGDGIRFYGPTLVSLTEWGSTSGVVPNNIDMNRYPATGNIEYSRTVTVSHLTADLIRDGNAVIVVHGIDYNNNHIYDFGALGVSDLDKTLPGEATAPALCGPLRPSSTGRSSPTAELGHRSSTTTYVASLTPEMGSGTDQASAPGPFLCRVGQDVRASWIAPGPL
jgi:hypothetical protein